MFQCLLAFLNEVVPFSIASIASFNASLVHLPLVIRILHLLIFFVFLSVLFKRWWDIFLMLVWLVLQSTSFCMRHIDHHDLNPFGPNPQHVGGVLSSPIRSTNLSFMYFGSMTNQGMFEMHMSLIVGKKLSMHKTIQSHPKLNFGL